MKLIPFPEVGDKVIVTAFDEDIELSLETTILKIQGTDYINITLGFEKTKQDFYGVYVLEKYKWFETHWKHTVSLNQYRNLLGVEEEAARERPVRRRAETIWEDLARVSIQNSYTHPDFAEIEPRVAVELEEAAVEPTIAPEYAQEYNIATSRSSYNPLMENVEQLEFIEPVEASEPITRRYISPVWVLAEEPQGYQYRIHDEITT